MAQVRLTERYVREVREAGDYFDEKLPGFFLAVGKRSRTYCVQRAVAGRSVRRKVGRAELLSLVEARVRARELLAMMASGINPREKEREEEARRLTLREAFELHLSAKGRSEKTISNYRSMFELHLRRWSNKQLSQIGKDRKGVRALHEKLTRESGAYSANATMRLLRAVYNSARRQHPELPESPTVNVSWNPERVRRDKALTPEGVASWYTSVQEVRNSVRRDFQLFLLFTGLRRESAANVAWVDLDLAQRTLFIPNPKGGEARAFTMPVSDFVMDLLDRRRRENSILFPDAEWVFPTRKGRGHNGAVCPIREPREDGLPGPHALRRTYASAAHAAGVTEFSLMQLLNHSTVTSVTHSYVTPFLKYLREDQEKTSALLLSWIKDFSSENQSEDVAKTIAAG